MWYCCVHTCTVQPYSLSEPYLHVLVHTWYCEGWFPYLVLWRLMSIYGIVVGGVHTRFLWGAVVHTQNSGGWYPCLVLRLQLSISGIVRGCVQWSHKQHAPLRPCVHHFEPSSNSSRYRTVNQAEKGSRRNLVQSIAKMPTFMVGKLLLSTILKEKIQNRCGSLENSSNLNVLRTVTAF